MHGTCTCSEFVRRDFFSFFVGGVWTSCFYCFALTRCWFMGACACSKFVRWNVLGVRRSRFECFGVVRLATSVICGASPPLRFRSILVKLPASPSYKDSADGKVVSLLGNTIRLFCLSETDYLGGWGEGPTQIWLSGFIAFQVVSMRIGPSDYPH